MVLLWQHSRHGLDDKERQLPTLGDCVTAPSGRSSRGEDRVYVGKSARQCEPRHRRAKFARHIRSPSAATLSITFSSFPDHPIGLIASQSSEANCRRSPALVPGLSSQCQSTLALWLLLTFCTHSTVVGAGGGRSFLEFTHCKTNQINAANLES